MAEKEPPFIHTGIDYYMPFRVSTPQRNHMQKIWGVIFTCLTSRTVHLDIVDSLSMDACLNAIEHILAQYGDITPALYSDNGTNFHGMDNAIRTMVIG